MELADRAVLPVAASGERPEEELIEAEEEAAPRDSLPTPELPSQSEIDDHNIDHCPYRSWCRHCVNSRGIGEQHRSQAAQQAAEEHADPVVFSVYGLMGGH